MLLLLFDMSVTVGYLSDNLLTNRGTIACTCKGCRDVLLVIRILLMLTRKRKKQMEIDMKNISGNTTN